jgi:hypothetical protein
MKAKIVNKLIVRLVSFLFYLIQSESIKVVNSLETEFAPGTILTQGVDLLTELGDLFSKLNNRFLLIDSLIMNIVDMVYSKNELNYSEFD